VPILPIDLLVIIIPLIAALLLLICCVVVWRCTELPKVLAPRTRKVEINTDPLDDFIVKEDTAMEDLDPDLTMNPVLLAKIAIERERGLAPKKKGNAGGGRGATGGLKRLGINLDGVKAKDGPKKVGLKDIDVRLQSQNKQDTERRRKEREEAKERKRLAIEAAAAAAGGDISEFQDAARARARKELNRKSSSSVEPSDRNSSSRHGEVDLARTLTVRTKTKREKNRALAADRLVAQAQSATLKADKAKMARAAAHLPACREISEQSAESIPEEEEVI